jgi:hypothetical protein
MGIKTSVAALLLRAKQAGVPFNRTATSGRQSLTVPVSELVRLARATGVPEPDWNTFATDGYCEDFLRQFLGAETITSFDASSYQAATVVHDFNRPIPPQFKNSFDAVIDGGTMEHIFDVRQVLENYMNLAKVGGSIFICTNANNLCGHGFYQFSSEFFYRVFSEANGFRVESLNLIETPLLFVELCPRQNVYAAVDPAVIGKRTVIVNDKPLSIFVHARRIADRPLFAEAPHQSGYRVRWDMHDARSVGATASEDRSQDIRTARTRDRFEYVSGREALRRRWNQRRRNSLRNRKWFTRVIP